VDVCECAVELVVFVPDHFHFQISNQFLSFWIFIFVYLQEMVALAVLREERRKLYPLVARIFDTDGELDFLEVGREFFMVADDNCFKMYFF